MITKINIDEIDSIFRLEKSCFPDDFTSKEVLIDQLNDERTSFYAIVEKGEVLAQIAIYNWKGLNDYIKIISLGVHPEHRNKGYGHQLMSFTIETMKKESMYVFKGETRASNTKMQRLFEAFGFEIEYEMADYYDHPNETAFRYLLNCEDH